MSDVLVDNGDFFRSILDLSYYGSLPAMDPAYDAEGLVSFDGTSIKCSLSTTSENQDRICRLLGAVLSEGIDREILESEDVCDFLDCVETMTEFPCIDSGSREDIFTEFFSHRETDDNWKALGGWLVLYLYSRFNDENLTELFF